LTIFADPLNRNKKKINALLAHSKLIHNTHKPKKKTDSNWKKANKSKSAGHATARPSPEEMGLQISSNNKIKTPLNNARYAKIK